jgi:S-(hydroxymethyl)mycothiol dehydrogenase
MLEFLGRGGALKPSWYGDCLPTRDFPMLIDLYMDGKYKLDEMITRRVPLEDFESALEKQPDDVKVVLDL